SAGRSLDRALPPSWRLRCTEPWSPRRWRAPHRRPAGLASRFRGRGAVRPTSTPYDKLGTFEIILFERKITGSGAISAASGRRRKRPETRAMGVDPAADFLGADQAAPRVINREGQQRVSGATRRVRST